MTAIAEVGTTLDRIVFVVGWAMEVGVGSEIGQSTAAAIVGPVGSAGQNLVICRTLAFLDFSHSSGILPFAEIPCYPSAIRSFSTQIESFGAIWDLIGTSAILDLASEFEWGRA